MQSIDEGQPKAEGQASPLDLVNQAPQGGKREVNHKGKVVFESERFNGSFDVVFHEAPVEPLMELEGRVVKLGPNGKEIETKRPYINYESGVEIKSDQITKKLVYEDGSEDPFFNLPKTRTFRISEKRPLSEVTLDPTDPTVSFGTVIPAEDVDKFSVDRVGDLWEEKPAGLSSLVKYLEERGLALVYPYSFGNGRNVFTAIVYVVRVEGKVYLVKKFCTGQLIFRHPVDSAESAPKATTVVEMPVLRIRKKKAAGVN